MSNPAFEQARLELSQRWQALCALITEQKASLARHETEAEKLEAELAAMDRARDLLSSPEPVKKRQAVQRVVMALFQPPGHASWDEDGIVEKTNLPMRSVHDFLLRAKRLGTLRCEKVDGVDTYSLPPTMSHTGAREAAE